MKTLTAGLVNTALGVFVVREELPEPRYLAGALLLGSVSYGVSVVLDAYALRLVGAAREAAYFATAPFVGVLASIVLLGDTLGVYDALAMASMAIGVGLLVRERHSHLHVHEPHVPDAHHRHEH